MRTCDSIPGAWHHATARGWEQRLGGSPTTTAAGRPVTPTPSASLGTPAGCYGGTTAGGRIPNPPHPATTPNRCDADNGALTRNPKAT